VIIVTIRTGRGLKERAGVRRLAAKFLAQGHIGTFEVQIMKFRWKRICLWKRSHFRKRAGGMF